jgi:ABC-type nitrate/sulfonate/bicarbonate transport system substrate-binding protein
MKTILLGTLAGLILSGSALAADKPTLRYGGGEGLTHLPFVIAQKEGFFAKEGLNVEEIKDALGGKYSNSQAAMMGYDPSIEREGKADMVAENGGFFIDAVLNGSDAVAVGVQMANPVHSLVVRPEIKDFADLKGKTVTMTALWDSITLTSKALLRKHGIGNDDFKFEAIKMSVARLDCMKAGKCAAIVAVQPTDSEAIALGEGFHRIGTIAEAGPVTFYIEIVRREWAKTHRDEIVRYLKAESDADKFLYDPTNKAEIRGILAGMGKYSDAIVDELLAAYTDPKQKIFPSHGEFDIKGFNNLLSFARLAGNPLPKPIPAADRFVDLSYLKDAGVK